MSDRIIIAGGSGFVGQALVKALEQAGCEVLVLTRGDGGEGKIHWDAQTAGDWCSHLDGAVAVINLCGENVAEGLWTARKKHRIRNSRIDPTRALVEGIVSVSNKPKALLQASGMGIYGNRGDKELDESSESGSGFMAEVCKDWEASAQGVTEYGIRLVVMRVGLVLGTGGGLLAKMLGPFRMYAGGHLGAGNQWMSWIHMADLVGVVQFLLQRDDLDGAFNLVAPEPATGKEFFQTLGRALHRPSWLHVPEFTLKIVFGEMAREMLLSSLKILPRRLLRSGYSFRFNRLEKALQNLLASDKSRQAVV